MKNSLKLFLVVAVILLSSGVVAGFNQPPLVDIHGQKEILAYGKLTLDGSKSFDPDGTIISRKWEIVRESDGKMWNVTGEKLVIEPPLSNTADYYRVTLKVTDNGGTDAKTTSKTVGFRIKPNKAPQIEKIEIRNDDNNDGIFDEGENFAFWVIMDWDSNDDPLIVEWNYSREIFNFSNSSILNPWIRVIFAPKTYESYEIIKVVARDTCSQSIEKEIRVAVKKKPANVSTPIEVEIIAPDKVDESISFTASVLVKKPTKPEDLTYEWWWNKYNETAISGRIYRQSPSLRFDNGGTMMELHLKVVDKKTGMSSTTSTTIFVDETFDDKPFVDASSTQRTMLVGEDSVLNATGSYDDREYLHGKIMKCWEISANIGGIFWKEQRSLCTRNDTLIYWFNWTGAYTVKLTGRDSSFQESLPQVISVQVVSSLPTPTPTSTIKKVATPTKAVVKPPPTKKSEIPELPKIPKISDNNIALIIIIIGIIISLYLIAKK